MGNGSFTQQRLLSTYYLLCVGLDVDSLQHSDNDPVSTESLFYQRD